MTIAVAITVMAVAENLVEATNVSPCILQKKTKNCVAVTDVNPLNLMNAAMNLMRMNLLDLN